MSVLDPALRALTRDMVVGQNEGLQSPESTNLRRHDACKKKGINRVARKAMRPKIHFDPENEKRNGYFGYIAQAIGNGLLRQPQPGGCVVAEPIQPPHES